MATMTLDDLVTQLRAAYGAHLSAVVLYGSAAGGEHAHKKSDFDILVLLDEVAPGALAAASAVARAWREAGNPPPMTMTLGEWRRSSDVFPMEYSDIIERHRVLYGVAPFHGIAVSQDHLRLQLEQQVLGKLLQLRQGALLAGADDKRQLALVTASFGTMMVLFRAVLRLHGAKPEPDNVALSQHVATLAGLDAAPFVRAARHVRGEAKLSERDAGPVLSGYLGGIEQLNAHLDRYVSPS